MNPLIELNLALILFLPWYLVLIWLFWRARARGQRAYRKLLVASIVSAALFAAALTGICSYRFADTAFGAIWKQILACVVAYWAFLTVLAMGYFMLRLPRTVAAK